MISAKLKVVICKELGLADFDLRDDTLASQVPGWDSLRHISVLTAVEKAYGVRFRSLEVLRLKNIGELQKLVDQKAKAA
jgi:acyl carrier protein